MNLGRNESNRFMSISEAMEKMGGVSRATFFRLRQNPNFPKGFQVSPGRILFSESELEAFIVSQRVGLSRRD